MNITRILLGTAAILSVPLIAMQFTNEVNWGPGDFLAIGALLIGTGVAYELISKRVRSTQHRVILGVVLVILMLLVWVDLAVGIFNIPGFSGS